MYLKQKNSVKWESHMGYTFWLPGAPTEKSEIINYGKPKSEQIWVRQELPDFYEDRLKEEEIMQRDEQKLVDSGDMKKVLYYDPVLESYRRREWNRRIFGVHIYLEGKVYYLTGNHYMYLQWSKCDHEINNGYPVFYDDQLDRFYFREYCHQNPFSLGYIIVGARGFGKTAEEVAVILSDMTRPPHNRKCAIQSKSKDDAKEVIFKEKMVLMFNHYPDFFKPTYSHGSKPENKMEFFRPAVTGNGTKVRFDSSLELGNVIYPRAAKAKAIDGGSYANVYNDEVGKCLKLNTPVLMYDGSIKKVQDISKGDVIMGDDSCPRKILGLGRGEEMMYDIIPKKGMTWGCNESHILSLKWCWQQPTTINGQKISKYDVVNITVRDYLNLNPTQQNNLVLYKVPIEYATKSHLIDPYFMGLWLGDGKSDKMFIYNQEPEVDDYLKAFSENNKHIPNDYMADSSENRLKLLAGIIDTDGSLNINGNKVNYEITQKNEILANDIQRLASSLGFGATLNPRISRMQREDKSVYECPTYRVTIFGDLHRIPCLVSRKKAPVILDHHKNRRNPLHTGFKVVPTGIDSYYGFSIDENRLFVLGDHTVTHNTDPKKEADVFDRMQVNIRCVYRNERKVGLLRMTTTVEEMAKGGAECEKIWKQSSLKRIDPNGYTVSKILPYFVSATSTKRQFASPSGIIDRKKAYQYIMDDRSMVSDDMNELSSRMRKDPIDESEAFIKPPNMCMFHTLILTKRREELRSQDTPIGRKGTLELVDPFDIDGEIFFSDDSTGPFTTFYMPEQEEGFTDTHEQRKILNTVEKRYNTAKGEWEWYPKNDDLFGGGIDPIKSSRTHDPRASKLAAYGFRRFDPMVDDPSDMQNWKSYNYFWRYFNRYDDPEIDFENIIRSFRFFGHSMMPEGNVTDLTKHIRNRGYENFMIVRKDFNDTVFEKSKRSKANEDDPVTTETEVTNAYVRALQTFVVRHGHRINDIEFIDQLLDFDPKTPTKYDLVIAGGYSLLSLRAIKYDINTEIESLKEVEDAFPMYNNSGDRSQIIVPLGSDDMGEDGFDNMLPQEFIDMMNNTIH